MVEFQPSAWSEASYLNVGASWLWDGAEHRSFNEGYRLLEYVEFRDATQFEPEIREMAIRARDEVLKLRERFPSIEAVAKFLEAKPDVEVRDSLNAGIACGLVGNVDAARRHFLGQSAEIWERSYTMYSKRPGIQRIVHIPEPDWHLELKSRARELADIVADREAFFAAISANIQVSRQAAKLPEIDVAHCLTDCR